MCNQNLENMQLESLDMITSTLPQWKLWKTPQEFETNYDRWQVKTIRVRTSYPNGYELKWNVAEHLDRLHVEKHDAILQKMIKEAFYFYTLRGGEQHVEPLGYHVVVHEEHRIMDFWIAGAVADSTGAKLTRMSKYANNAYQDTVMHVGTFDNNENGGVTLHRKNFEQRTNDLRKRSFVGTDACQAHTWLHNLFPTLTPGSEVNYLHLTCPIADPIWLSNVTRNNFVREFEKENARRSLTVASNDVSRQTQNYRTTAATLFNQMHGETLHDAIQTVM